MSMTLSEKGATRLNDAVSLFAAGIAHRSLREAFHNPIVHQSYAKFTFNEKSTHGR